MHPKGENPEVAAFVNLSASCSQTGHSDIIQGDKHVIILELECNNHMHETKFTQAANSPPIDFVTFTKVAPHTLFAS